MSKFETYAMRLWRIAIALLLFGVVALTISQVFARYVLNDSIVWAEEATRLLYVWMIMIAAIGSSHMRIGLIDDSERFKWFFSSISLIGALVALGLIGWGGWKLATLFSFDRYVTLDLSKSWYFAAAIVGAILWMIVMMWRYIARIRGVKIP